MVEIESQVAIVAAGLESASQASQSVVDDSERLAERSKLTIKHELGLEPGCASTMQPGLDGTGCFLTVTLRASILAALWWVGDGLAVEVVQNYQLEDLGLRCRQTLAGFGKLTVSTRVDHS